MGDIWLICAICVFFYRAIWAGMYPEIAFKPDYSGDSFNSAMMYWTTTAGMVVFGPLTLIVLGLLKFGSFLRKVNK